jgi:VWFA-related protein
MGIREGINFSVTCRMPFLRFARRTALFLFPLVWLGGARAQSPPAPPPADQTPKAASDKTEISTSDTGTTFKLRVNLVQVRVVVRDAGGKPVGNLNKEDFQLFDQGKLQTITNFGVETAQSRRARAEAAAKTQTGTEEETSAKVSLPERFVAVVFDDVHINMDDATTIRVAAGKFLDRVTPTDRIAFFSTSGQMTQDFTSDIELLRQTLLKLVPRNLFFSRANNCPDVSYYMADQILNKHNDQALAVVTEEVLQCEYGGDNTKIALAQASARSATYEALAQGDQENQFMYAHLEDALRRLSGMPGERIMLLASPGFLLTTETLDEMGIIDRANRSNIVINTLDARGLYTPDLMGDISQQISDTYKTLGYKGTYRISAQFDQSAPLMDIAYGPGGTYFHNSNDLVGGLIQGGAAPEVSYVLGFSPQNQKMDGKYHTLKVTLSSKKLKYNVQARRGYFAPKKVDDPQEQAKAEIQEAVFSQDEIHDLPLELQTQYFKTGQTDARLSVVSHVDVKGMRFRKADGRNMDDLIVATAIFDENGNYITGGEKILQMKLLDPTYDRLSRTGIMVKSSFEIKPGKYMVRQVVRDSEGAQMAARNGAVVIPY